MTDIDIDAIRQRADRYKQTGAGSGKTIQAIQLANTDVPALLAKVDELTAKIERRRLRLVEAEADLLNVRGILSPNGHPRRVPVDLVPTVAPAVQWLADRVDELTVAVAKSREQAATYANEIGSLKAELEHLREQVFVQKPVVEAAEAWAEMCEDGDCDDTRKVEDALHDAIEQHRLMDTALTSARAELPAEATR